MNGKIITELVYLLSRPIQGRIEKVVVFVERIGDATFLMLKVPGIQSEDSFQRLSNKPDFANIQKHCTWDEKFSCWKMRPTMVETKEKSLVKLDKYNHRNSGPRRLVNPNAPETPAW